MRSLILLAILTLSLQTALAQNLCTPDCDEFSISFPNGGSIEAIESMTLSFGDNGEFSPGLGGTINAAIPPSNSNFFQGGSLALAAGENIIFGNDGYLSLGNGGNIIGSHFKFTASGNLTISVSGEGSTITLTGGLLIDGLLQISTSNLTVESDIQASNGNISNGSTIGSTNLSGDGTITIDAPGILTIDGGIIPLDPSLSLVISEIGSGTNPITVAVDPDTFTPLQDLSLLEGFELPTADGNLCIVSGNECIADDGKRYVLEDGTLVAKTAPKADKNGAGGFSGYWLFGLFLFAFALRNRGNFPTG